MVHLKSDSSQVMLRKLSRIEQDFDTEFQQNGNMVLLRVFMVHLADGCNIDLELIKRACVFWARRHPFLRAQVWRHENGREKYFVPLDEPEAFKFDNVKLFEIDRHDDWLQLLDKDLTEEFPKTDRPLWTVKVARVRAGVSAENDFNYVFIFKTQHSITDGRNAFEVFRQLLNVIAALSQGRVCAEMDESAVEHSPLTLEEVIRKLKLDEALKFVPNPNVDKLNRMSVKFGNSESEPEHKFRAFCTDKTRLTRLYTQTKLKTRNAKLTSVLSTVVCLAFKNLYRKHSVTDIPLGKYQFILMGSLRERLSVPLTQMGVYTTQYERVLRDGEGEAELSLENVWKLSETESLELHKDRMCLEKMLEFVLAAPDMVYTDFNFNFKMSNIGQMRNTDAENLTIKQCFVRTLRSANAYGRPGSNILFSLASVGDGQLCWSVSYNERPISSEFVAELMDEINLIIDKMIE